MNGLVFNMSLTDLITGPSKRMQKSMLDTSKALLAENQNVVILERSVASLEKALVKSAALGNDKAYSKQSGELLRLKYALSQTDASQVRLAESMKAGASEMDASSTALAGLIGTSLAAVQVIGRVVKGFADLVIAGAAFTISSVQSKQAAIQMFRAMAGGKDAGDQLFAMMEDLATQLPQTKDELTAWSKEFTAMGILNQDALRAELRATASAAALMGDEGVEAFTMLTRKITESVATTGKLKLSEKQLASLAKTGANVSDVATAMGISTKTLSAELKNGTVNASAFGDALNKALTKKGQGPLDRMMGSLDVLKKKFDEAIGDMFEDVDISPFVDQMKGLLDVFTQAEPSGQAMKAGIGAFFKSFFQWTAKAILVAKHMFLQIIIWSLKAYIAIKPWVPAIKMIAAVLAVAALAFASTFVPAVLAAVVAMGMLAASVLVAAAPFILIGALVVGVYEAFTNWGAISDFVSGVVNSVTATLSGWLAWLSDLGSKIGTWASDTASQLVDGIVAGVKNGTGYVVDAIKGLATNAMTAFKKTLGIASPSKEFMKLGDFTAKGFTMGVRANDNAVAGATAGLADSAVAGATAGLADSARAPDAPAASATPAAGQSPASGGVTVNVMPGAIVLHGVQGDASELTERAVSLMFEKAALTQGVAA